MAVQKEPVEHFKTKNCCENSEERLADNEATPTVARKRQFTAINSKFEVNLKISNKSWISKSVIFTQSKITLTTLENWAYIRQQETNRRRSKLKLGQLDKLSFGKLAQQKENYP